MPKNNRIFAILGGLFLIGAMTIKRWRKPIIGVITSKFGYRIHPVTKQSTYHNGIDIAAPVGTKIYAPASGKVENLYSNAAGGLQLIIKHDNGFKTGYAHLSKILYPIGTKVRKGQIIALTGNTGATTGPHLHFTLTNELGEKVDPEKYIYKA